MDIKGFGSGLKGSLQGAVDSVRSKAAEIELPDAGEIKDSLQGAVDNVRAKAAEIDIKQAGAEAQKKVKNLFKKSEGEASGDAALSMQNITRISCASAIKIIYFLMAADGEIYHSEEEKFDLIGKELDPDFADSKEQIISECRASLNKVIDPEDYYDALQDGAEAALLASQNSEGGFISPKLLIWDLLSVAYSDESYDEIERRFLKYIVRKLNIDKAVFLEMESSMLTLMDIEREVAWIKTTNRPYLTIEAMVNELADRKNVIVESVIDLINL
jgi:uncharacterized tellurite resistance protein B-like protein